MLNNERPYIREFNLNLFLKITVRAHYSNRKVQLFQQVILKETLVTPSFNTNIKKFKIIQIYKYGKYHTSKLNFFLKIIPKKFKKFKYKEFYKKKKNIGLLIRTRQWSSRNDGSFRKFNENSILIFNKKLNILKTKIIGPSILELMRKKYFIYFKYLY